MEVRHGGEARRWGTEVGPPELVDQGSQDWAEVRDGAEGGRVIGDRGTHRTHC